MIGFEIVLGIGLAVSAGADTVTTRQALSACHTCSEGNPIMRPFAHSTFRLTVAQAAGNSAIWFGSKHMKNRGKRAWWVPLVVGTAMHTAAAIHNSRVKSRADTIESLKRRLDALEGR